MKKDSFVKWLKALNSNKYIQGKSYLHNNNTYCALGILCEISKTGEWKLEPGKEDTYFYHVEDQNFLSRSLYFPPKEVFEWAGIGDDQARKLKAYVAALNDDGASLKEIADRLKLMVKDPDDSLKLV